MCPLQRLRADHEQPVLAFELENRSYFAASVSDRGDEYFQEFGLAFKVLLADQEAGVGAYFVLVSDDGLVMGRFHLKFVGGGTAVLGYRVAEVFAGQGVATSAVRELCEHAAGQLGVRAIRAAVALGNTASERVLVKAGFVSVGPADPEDVGGNAGTSYQLQLAAKSSDR